MTVPEERELRKSSALINTCKSDKRYWALLCAARGQIETETAPPSAESLLARMRPPWAVDDRLTDGQVHAYVGIFGREEAIEKEEGDASDRYPGLIEIRRERCRNV